jgi:multidrug efflux system outer membrane protein
VIARRIALLAAGAVTAACAMGPDYRRPELPVPEEFDSAAAATAVPADAAAALDAAWWQAFDDAVLTALVQEALRENRDLVAASARVEQAAAALTVARAPLFPQVGYDGSGTRQQSSGTTATPLPPTVPNPQTAYSGLLTAAWEIDLWGRIRRETEAARAGLLASQEARRGVVLTLTSAVVGSYLQLRSLDEQLVIVRETVRTREESLRVFEARRRAGVVSDLEMAQVRSELESARAALPALELQLEQTENALSVLLGRNPGTVERGRRIAELGAPPLPAGLPSDLLERRPDVRQAEENLVAANALMGAARARYFPTISLTGAFGGVSQELDALFEGPSEAWSYGGSITGPLFAAGAIRAQSAQAQARRKEALAGYELAVQNAFRDAENALTAAQRTRERLDILLRQVASLRDYARLARRRYDGGYTSYLEVLDSERTLLSSEVTVAQAQADYRNALVGTYKALGGGWIDLADAQTAAAP